MLCERIGTLIKLIQVTLIFAVFFKIRLNQHGPPLRLEHQRYQGSKTQNRILRSALTTNHKFVILNSIFYANSALFSFAK